MRKDWEKRRRKLRVKVCFKQCVDLKFSNAGATIKNCLSPLHRQPHSLEDSCHALYAVAACNELSLEGDSMCNKHLLLCERSEEGHCL